MFSIHARNSFLQIDPLTLTVFDHFARFFCQLFSKLSCLDLGGDSERASKRASELASKLTVFEAFAHYSFCCFCMSLRHPV